MHLLKLQKQLYWASDFIRTNIVISNLARSLDIVQVTQSCCIESGYRVGDRYFPVAIAA